MTWRAHDPRRSVDGGSDPRRFTLDPSDQARAEALAERCGGVLTVDMLTPGTMRWRWRDDRGTTIAVDGPSSADCVTLMQQAIAADVIDHYRGHNRGNV